MGATEDYNSLGNIKRPNGTTVVTDAVGLLNLYEYQSSNNGSTNGYLNNGLYWDTLTPNTESSSIRNISSSGYALNNKINNTDGIRPSIVLKKTVKIISGKGTLSNPYRLIGDNDTNLKGTKLNTRYSGEYIRFGTGENNLYRIVSHENRTGTKITSAEPLKDSGVFKLINFGADTIYSSNNTIGTFLNGDYLTNYVGNSYIDMLEENSIWYSGFVESGANYKLAKYKDINMTSYVTNNSATVGILRAGELLSGQFERNIKKGSEETLNLTVNYWTTTTYSISNMIRNVSIDGANRYYNNLSSFQGIKPALNLKQNVIITGGTGTKADPFTITIN